MSSAQLCENPLSVAVTFWTLPANPVALTVDG